MLRRFGSLAVRAVGRLHCLKIWAEEIHGTKVQGFAEMDERGNGDTVLPTFVFLDLHGRNADGGCELLLGHAGREAELSEPLTYFFIDNFNACSGGQQCWLLRSKG